MKRAFSTRHRFAKTLDHSPSWNLCQRGDTRAVNNRTKRGPLVGSPQPLWSELTIGVVSLTVFAHDTQTHNTRKYTQEHSSHRFLHEISQGYDHP